jgi:DNA-3-methyladenine glycosylase II
MVAKGQSPRDLAIGKPRGLPLISEQRRFAVIEHDEHVAQGVEHLIAIEPRFARVVENHGMPSARRVQNELSSLLKIIVEQLISLKAADAIWQRIETRLHPFEAEEILKIEHDQLKLLGLTGAKTKCFHDICRAVNSGALNFSALHQISNEEVLKKLMSLSGIGPWTADIYLLSALGRADACPSSDLALQVAAQDLLGLKERPSPKQFLAVAEAWRPWRSVAARLLWSHYRGLKGLNQRVK